MTKRWLIAAELVIESEGGYKQMMKGVKYRKEGKEDRAIAELGRALILAQTNNMRVLAHYNLGGAYETQGKIDKCIEELDKAISYCNVNQDKVTIKNIKCSILLDRKKDRDTDEVMRICTEIIDGPSPDEKEEKKDLGLDGLSENQLEEIANKMRDCAKGLMGKNSNILERTIPLKRTKCEKE